MKVLPLLFSISVLLGLSRGQDFILQLETKTGDGGGMGSLGHIDLAIYYPSQGQNHCSIHHLNGQGNDFQNGQVDVFEGDELQSCEHAVS